jgi:hypothetical protein
MNDLALLAKRSSWTKETANIHGLRGATRDCYVQFYNALNTASSETIKKLDATFHPSLFGHDRLPQKPTLDSGWGGAAEDHKRN